MPLTLNEFTDLSTVGIDLRSTHQNHSVSKKENWNIMLDAFYKRNSFGLRVHVARSNEWRLETPFHMSSES
jgi:hypothetical protein